MNGPAGYTARCAWPWPVDSSPRWVELGPDQRLHGAVPLVATDTSAPLFPDAGEYALSARFEAAPGRSLTSAPLAVRRSAPNAASRAAALRDRDVLQSLLSASVLGAAAGGLATLGSGLTVTTRTLSALALGRIADIAALLEGDGSSTAEIVGAVTAVLPAGVAGADPRRTAIEHLVGPADEAYSLFRGVPS